MGTRPVFLTGFMGAGKTTVGRLLADRLDRVFADTDRRVEQADGRPVDRIIRESGEGFFRDLEERVLHGLGDAIGTIVATGGGLFMGARQRAHMKRTGTVVWLDVRFDVAASRVDGGSGRPLWPTGDPVAARAWFDRRCAVYALAHARVGAEDEPEVVVERVLRLLERDARPG